jgi:hypothetical protein
MLPDQRSHAPRLRQRQPLPGAEQQPRRTESSGSPRMRSFQNSQRNYERYLVLARAEALSGDRIAAENYFQHVVHYLRSMQENAN